MNYINTESKAHYQLITQALHYLQDQQINQPSLQQLAAHLNISPGHLQRVFQRWVGAVKLKWLYWVVREFSQGTTDLPRHLLTTAPVALATPETVILLHPQALLDRYY